MCAAGDHYSEQAFKVLDKMSDKNPRNTNGKSVADYVHLYVTSLAKQEQFFRRVLPGMTGFSGTDCCALCCICVS